MLATDTLRILRTVARSSRMITVQVWCKHSLFQVSCGLTYAPEYVHCFQYCFTLASDYSHNATSKMFQVSCSIHILYNTPWGMLETENSSFYTTPLALTHCPRRYRCCQTILDCSYFVKWDVQSFLYEPRLKTNANGLDDHKSTVKCAHIFLATSPGLSVVKNSNYSYMDRWNLPSPLYEPRMRNSQWTIIIWMG